MAKAKCAHSTNDSIIATLCREIVSNEQTIYERVPGEDDDEIGIAEERLASALLALPHFGADTPRGISNKASALGSAIDAAYPEGAVGIPPIVRLAKSLAHDIFRLRIGINPDRLLPVAKAIPPKAITAGQ